MIRSLVSTIVLAVLLVGCGDGTGPESGTLVTIGFTAGSSAAQTSGAQAAPNVTSAARVVTSDGDNGILTFTDLWIIVDEFELEAVSGSCESGEESECPDFEAPPSFLHLELDGDFAEVTTAAIPAGSYDELEFEVKDLLDEDDDEEEAAQIQAVRDQIADAGMAVADWPDEASMLIEGEFQLVDGMGNDVGGPSPFRVYVDAEVEIEIEFDEILVVPMPADEPVTLTVDLLLGDWFVLPNGNVLDLSQFDFDPVTMSPILEFEFEFEFDHHGIEVEIEIG